MISPQNVMRHELIGLDVLVSGAANPTQRGISGRIIDETKNLLVIETSVGIKRVPKMQSRFQCAHSVRRACRDRWIGNGSGS